MQCALNECLNCADKWKDIVPELELNRSEQISFLLFLEPILNAVIMVTWTLE